VLLVNRWVAAFVPIAGLAAAGLAYALFGMLYAGIVLLATISWAAFGKSFVGSTPVPAGSEIDPAAVRRYREEHPGTTITDAINAVVGSGK
jgi:hypothetical protein